MRSLLAFAFALIAASCGSAPPATVAPPPPVAPVPEAAPRELGGLGNGDCSTKALLTQMGGGCARIKSRNASAGNAAAASEFATDDDACTVWSSGGMAPQEIGLDLEKEQPLTGLLLVPDMTPPEADMRHLVEVKGEQGQFHKVIAVEGKMTSAHGYAVVFPATVNARWVKVTTQSAGTFVAWREVAPVVCGAAHP